MNDELRALGAPALPSVNLLPKDIAEKRKMRAVRASAMIAILVAVVAVGLGYVLALGAKQLADNNLKDKREDQTLALAERDAKSGVYYDYLRQEGDEFTLAQLGYGEILYSQFAPLLLVETNEETSVETLEFFGPSALGLGGVSSDPVFGGGIGTVNFAVRSDSVEAATAFISRLEGVSGLSRVWAQTEAYAAEGGDPYWLVEGSGVITPSPLTLRLVPDDGLTGIDPTVFANPHYDPEAEAVDDGATVPDAVEEDSDGDDN